MIISELPNMIGIDLMLLNKARGSVGTSKCYGGGGLTKYVEITG